MIWKLIFSLVSSYFYYTTQLPEYHQNDYDVVVERVVSEWTDPLILKDVKFDYFFYNRSKKVINASATLLVNLSRDLVGEIQVYKFLSNEYRYFPLSLATNLCTEYKNNNFDVKSMVKYKSNIVGCPAPAAFYYVYNLDVDFSRMPPFIPRGRYKTTLKVFHNKALISRGSGYGAIVDKPLQWTTTK